MGEFFQRKFFYAAFLGVLFFSPSVSRASDAIYENTLLVANVLSANVIDVYNDYIINPLANVIFSITYDEPNVAYVPTVKTVEAHAEPASLPPPQAPVVQTAAPLSDFDLIAKIREVLRGENMSAAGPQGPQGQQGPQGPAGPRGPQGPAADTSRFVSRDLFDAQTNALLSSIENNIDGFAESLGEEIGTGTIKLTGSTGVITINPASAAGTYMLTLPTDDGTSGQVLATDGNGILSWTTIAASGANAALSNLASVAINTTLVSDTDNTDDVGTSSVGWRTGYFDTSLVSPFVIGGVSTTQDLTFQTTSGAGATGADMHFLVGNNGATEALTILNSGSVGIGTTAPDGQLHVNRGSSTGGVTSSTAQKISFTNNGGSLSALGVTDRALSIDHDVSGVVGSGRLHYPVGLDIDMDIVSTLNGEQESYGIRVDNTFAGSTNSGDTAIVHGIKVTAAGNIDTDIASAQHVGGYFVASGVADTNYGLLVQADGATNNSAIAILSPTSNAVGNYAINSTSPASSYFAGNIGIGDSTPNSLLTIGNGDLFQVDSSGQIGSQQAPQSDYLFSLDGSTVNDYSRIIHITQANNANEDSAVINVANTASPGSVTSDRDIRNILTSLTPSATVSQGGTFNFIGAQNNLNVGQITLGDSSLSAVRTNMYGTNNIVTGNFGINDNDGAGGVVPRITAVRGEVDAGTAVITAADGVDYDVKAGEFIADFTNSDNSGGVGVVYGVYAQSRGVLSTVGNSFHYGLYSFADGTADSNYGIYADASGATSNYGIYINNPAAGANNYALYSAASAQSYFAGNVGIGDTTPDYKLSLAHSNSAGSIDQWAQYIDYADSGGASGLTDTSKAGLRINVTDSGTYATGDGNSHFISGLQNNVTFSGNINNLDPFVAITGVKTTSTFTGTVNGASAAASVYGNWAQVSGELGTTGQTSHAGSYIAAVAGSADSNYGSFIGSVSGATNNYGIYISSPAAGANNYALYSVAPAQSYLAGNLGIANVSPSVALDVTGDIEYTGTITDVSDERLKENIEDFTGALDIISRLDAKSYNMKNDKGEEVGFIAQEVQRIFPGVVSVIDPEKGYLGMSYVSLIPVVSEAVKELNLNLESVALSVEEESELTFADRFFGRLAEWLGDATNGLTRIFSDQIETRELCVADESGGKTCITKAQLDELLSGAGQANVIDSGSNGASQETDSNTSVGSSQDTADEAGSGADSIIIDSNPVDTPVDTASAGMDTATDAAILNSSDGAASEEDRAADTADASSTDMGSDAASVSSADSEAQQ